VTGELPPIAVLSTDVGVTETAPPAVVPDLPAAPAFELELEFDLDGLEELATPASGDEHPAVSAPSLSEVDALDFGLVLPAAAAAAADAPGDAGATRCSTVGDDYQSDDYEALEELADDNEFAELEIIAEELALPGEEVPITNDIFAAPSPDMTTAVTATHDEDAQSHFDLGIAYKEMGMFGEAINEFASAARDPSRLLDCLILKGQCLTQWGELVAAEAVFKEALANPSLTDAIRIALRYELGLLYESTARPLEALESFEFVAGRDEFFRDVADKQKALRRMLGLDEETMPPAGERPGRDRISYL
jgi:tetratricopeptide (TPR) repeat protein